MNLSSVNDNQKSDQVYLVTNPSATTTVQPVQFYRTSVAKPNLFYLQAASSTPIVSSAHHHSVSSSSSSTTKFGNNRVRYIRTTTNLSTSSTVVPPTDARVSSQSRQTLSYKAIKPKSSSSFRTVPRSVDIDHTIGNKKDKIGTTLVATTTRTNQFTLNSNTNSDPNTTNTTYAISSTVSQTSDATNVSTADQLTYRYRTILGNLLQLKNGLIRRTITEAIQQKLRNQTSEDLLNVIFKSFELILRSVKIEEIYLNVNRFEI